MKPATTILATLALGVFTATAGTPAPAPTGKSVPPSCPLMDPCAGGISYNNVEILYASTSDLFSEGVDADGVVLGLEYALGKNFYLAAEAQYHDISAGGTNVDMWTLSAGAGAYFPLTQNIHLVGEVGAIWVSLDGGSDDNENRISEDEVGWYATPHLRAKWGCLEAHLGARFIQIDDLSRNTDFDEESWFLNLYYQVAPGWDITAGISDSDERTVWTAGVRYKF